MEFCINKVRRHITIPTEGEDWTTPEQIKDESGNRVAADPNGICAMP